MKMIGLQQQPARSSPAMLRIGGLALCLVIFASVFYLPQFWSDSRPSSYFHSYGTSSCFASSRPAEVSHTPLPNPPIHSSSRHPSFEDFNYNRDAQKYGLDDEQCEAFFPGLFNEIDRVVNHTKSTRGKITPEDMDDDMKEAGAMRAMIYNGRLYIIDSNRGEDELFGHRAIALFSTLNRALAAAPNPTEIPNIEFTISMHDTTHLVYGDHSDRPMWSWTRKTIDKNVWVVPDFAKWNWVQAGIGTPQDVRQKMIEDEARAEAKIPTLMWRGNVATNTAIRESLVNQTKDKAWADVHETYLDKADARIAMDEHCRWQYLMYTEGHSYSGRLKYLQNCESVIFSHRMDWFIPWHSLLVPDGPEQNYVLVERDFKDLDWKVELLLKDEKLRNRIARNSVKTFRDRYLAPAAEACYWRRLFKAWREVTYEPVRMKWDEEQQRVLWRGFPFEAYSVTGKIG